MEHKNIGLIIAVVAVFTMLETGCSISIARNYYSSKPTAPINTDSISYTLKLESQTHKPNNGQR